MEMLPYSVIERVREPCIITVWVFLRELLLFSPTHDQPGASAIQNRLCTDTTGIIRKYT